MGAAPHRAVEGAARGRRGCGPGHGRRVLARADSARGLRPHQRLVRVGPVLDRRSLPLVAGPLVDEAVVTGLTSAHPALAVLVRQEARLIQRSRQQLQEGKVGDASQGRALRVKELEGVNGKFSLAQRALHVCRGGLAVLLRLVEVCDVLLDGRRPT